jgi:hypothetical protein
MDFLAKLAALVSRPRLHRKRDHGMFAPNRAHCALVSRAGRGKSRPQSAKADVRTPAERRPRLANALHAASPVQLRSPGFHEHDAPGRGSLC